jgi:hypothetical protein
VGIFTAKPGGTFLGNITRAIGINKTAVPPLTGFSPGVNQNSVPIQTAPANLQPVGVVPGQVPVGNTNTSAGATVGVSGKDFYILLAIVAAFFLLSKKIGL